MLLNALYILTGYGFKFVVLSFKILCRDSFCFSFIKTILFFNSNRGFRLTI